MSTTTPMQLQEWANAHDPLETLAYKEGYWNQITFVRDKIGGLFGKTLEEYDTVQDGMTVISTHTRMCVRLPVFQLTLADGTVFTMRSNFSDWKMSVESPRDVEANFMDLFNQNVRISRHDCEGFPKELVYGSYKESKRRFTIEICDDNRLFTFFWIFSRQVPKLQK